MDNANTITDMAKVCYWLFFMHNSDPNVFYSVFPDVQTQNNVYELVSDMNQKQELLEERIASLEDRLTSIQEHMEALPDVLAKVVQIAMSSQRQLLDPSGHTDQPSGPRHTHLHPSDATRPSWSATSLTGGSPPDRNTARNTFLVPATPQPGSQDA